MARPVEKIPRERRLTLAGKPALLVQEAAKRLGRSTQWVRTHARELEGRIVNNAWRFPVATIERMRKEFADHEITPSGPPPNGTTRVTNIGPRAAAIFKRFELGQPISEIVRELEEPPDFVLEMRAKWIACYESDRRGLTFKCNCGAPGDPHIAFCVTCGPRARVLTDEQIAILADAGPRAPDMCTCDGCGSTVAIHVSRHICSKCVTSGAQTQPQMPSTPQPPPSIPANGSHAAESSALADQIIAATKDIGTT